MAGLCSANFYTTFFRQPITPPPYSLEPFNWGGPERGLDHSAHSPTSACIDLGHVGVGGSPANLEVYVWRLGHCRACRQGSRILSGSSQPASWRKKVPTGQHEYWNADFQAHLTPLAHTFPPFLSTTLSTHISLRKLSPDRPVSGYRGGGQFPGGFGTEGKKLTFSTPVTQKN